MTNNKNFKDAFISFLKSFGILEDDKKEEMVSYEVIYEPDVVDSHGHWASKETLEKACENFNKHLKNKTVGANLFHLTETDKFSVEDTWIHKELDVTVDGTGQPIKAGSWICKLQYNDPDLWELKKAGCLGGVSMGARANINEETGELTNITFDEDEEDESTD